MPWTPVNIFETHEIVIWGIAAVTISLALVLVFASLLLTRDLTRDGQQMRKNHKKELRSYVIAGVVMLIAATPVIVWESNIFSSREQQNYASLISAVKEETKISIDEQDARLLLDNKSINVKNETVKLVRKGTNNFFIEMK